MGLVTYLAGLDLFTSIDSQMWVCSGIVCFDNANIHHVGHAFMFLENILQRSFVGVASIVAADYDAKLLGLRVVRGHSCDGVLSEV